MRSKNGKPPLISSMQQTCEGEGGRGGVGNRWKVRDRKLGCRGVCSSFEGRPRAWAFYM